MISNSSTSTLGLYDLKRQIDAFGGVDYFRPNLAGGYLKNARVMLANGDIVKSTVDGNTNNPNVNMTGWVYNPVNLKLNTIDNSIKRTLTEVVYDQLIDVTWFGANGNWNKDTQTGANSTVAVQNAIAYLATLGTRRQGGKRGLKFPKGSYRIDSLTLPAALGFGLDFIGDGVKTTNLYFDHTSTNPAITSEIEFVQFRNISPIGSLDESWVTTRTPFYKGRLPDGRADIDVTFFNCEFTAWNTVAQIHGRSCVFESCSIGLVICGIDIVVEDYTHGADTNLMQSKFATMRHYVFRNCRLDNCSRGYRVSGAGEMLDYINNLLWTNNDVTNMDVLIDAPNAQFVNSFIGSSTYLGSFANTVIKAKAFHMSNISQNVTTKSTNYASVPTTNANSIEFFVDLSAPCSNLTIANNTVRGIRSAFYRNTSASQSKSVSIYGNNLPEFGAWKGGNTAVNFAFFNANHINLLIKDNNFSCSNISGSYYLFNFNNIQQAKDIIFKDNTAPFTWADRIFSHTPTVYAGASATTGTSSIKLNQYITDGDYVHGHLYFSGTIPESSGSVLISLPVPAIALVSTFSSVLSGSAKIIMASGVVSAGFVFADALVNASSQRIELRKQKDMVISNIDAADVPATLTMSIEYKYRFK